MEDYSFTIKYDDGKKDKHEIDAYVLADAIKGFADFSVSLMQSSGSASSTRSVVTEIRPGCVEVEFLIRSAFAIGEMGFSALGYMSTFQSVIELFRGLAGRPPKSVESTGDGNVVVQTNNGNITINQNTYNLVMASPNMGEACNKFIRQPLKAGLEQVSIASGENKISSIEKAEADSFQKLDLKDHLHEYDSTVWLRIVRPVLDGSSKWTFDNGSGAPLPADIKDAAFLTDVKNGVHRFGNGDYLYVEMKSVQRRVGRKLSSENSIQKVIKIEQGAGDQLTLSNSV
ncbi:hypothetical protein [Micavibrio aeruginosavorus]|uniref:hypothetical protein n=1 Tax=Micavibrio aeruginosavorus TaxID=349221 RepID=UPI003F4ADDFF